MFGRGEALPTDQKLPVIIEKHVFEIYGRRKRGKRQGRKRKMLRYEVFFD